MDDAAVTHLELLKSGVNFSNYSVKVRVPTERAPRYTFHSARWTFLLAEPETLCDAGLAVTMDTLLHRHRIANDAKANGTAEFHIDVGKILDSLTIIHHKLANLL